MIHPFPSSGFLGNPEGGVDPLFLVAKVAVDKAAYHFDRLFDYLVPEEMAQAVRPGCRVLVPFGGGNRKRQGLVMGLERTAEPQKLKPLFHLADRDPPLTDEMLDLARFLKAHTFCTYYDAVKVLLPLGEGLKIKYRYYARPGDGQARLLPPQALTLYQLIGSREAGMSAEELRRTAEAEENSPALLALLEQGLVERRETSAPRVRDETVTMLRLSDAYSGGECGAAGFSQKQRAVLEFLARAGSASMKEACYMCGVTKAVPEALQRKGAVVFFSSQVYRNPYEGAAAESGAKPPLTPDQRAAAEKLLIRYRTEKPCVSLLYGVTGSGKTEVYLWLIDKVLEEGRTVIAMVPEIALTPQALKKFHSRYGSQVAVLHSGLSVSQRMDEWKRIRDGGARIVVGTRSAVFAPLENIGLIVMDEEQERTYQSDAAPRYHARDVAKFRCMRHGAMLLLASATPGVESYFQAQRREGALVSLDSRFSGGQLPKAHIVDMNLEPYQAQDSGISGALAGALQENLDRGEQSILLLNRRGYSTIVKCSTCGEVVKCPNCSIPLTYHAKNGRLLCHYCGHIQEAVTVCAACGGEYVKYMGIGTQKVEERLQALFPGARVLRMDTDTTGARFAHEKYLSEFGAGDYDILIGTQMVAKGLDFPRVTLAGVLSADMYLYRDDFRGYERTFDLLTQVVGRSGRAGTGGRAYIQTMSPEHDIIRLAAMQDYRAFYQLEIAGRRLLLYPPFCDICAIGFSGERQEEVRRAAQSCLEMLTRLVKGKYRDIPVRCLGPCESGVLRVNNKFRYKLLIKCRNDRRFREMAGELLIQFGRDKVSNGINYYADMNFDGMI